MKKSELRKTYKLKRKNLTNEAIKTLQENIYKQVLAFDFSPYKTIHIFLPIAKQQEINTQPIIDFLWSQDKTIVISKSDFEHNTLTNFIFERNTLLKVNAYGIPEPVNAKPIDNSNIDLVFVPLLISDEKNYRVGYGKGFYDRFLATCRKDLKTIGLNFFPPVKTIEDINEFDIALDEVIFPK